jgi:hypothetical protein
MKTDRPVGAVGDVAGVKLGSFSRNGVRGSRHETIAVGICTAMVRNHGFKL